MTAQTDSAQNGVQHVIPTAQVDKQRPRLSALFASSGILKIWKEATEHLEREASQLLKLNIYYLLTISGRTRPSRSPKPFLRLARLLANTCTEMPNSGRAASSLAASTACWSAPCDIPRPFFTKIQTQSLAKCFEISCFLSADRGLSRCTKWPTAPTRTISDSSSSPP